MKRKFKVISTILAVGGLIIGWNLQNKPVVEALLGSNTFVTRSTSGGDTNNGALSPSISHDGRYVVYQTSSTNIKSGDTNGQSDIYLEDINTNAVTIVSVDSSGNQSNGSSFNPIISGDGKFVVYQSNATNLVSGDTNGVPDLFRYNISSGVTERVSVDSSGNQSNGESRNPSLDTQGRFIVFDTSATNLTSTSDTNSTYDIILKDMSTGSTTLISKSNAGTLGNGSSSSPQISCDGRFIVFSSTSSNLTTDTDNGWGDVFLTDMLITQTVSNITRNGDQTSYQPYISCDGNYIAFMSRVGNFGVNPTTSYATYDVYRYNRLTSVIDAVSTRENGSTATDESYISQNNQGGGPSIISSDGRYIIFYSNASSFVTSTTDTNNGHDLFLRDMNSTGFKIISQNSSGSLGNNQNIDHASRGAAFSGTNRIVFSSSSTNLVSGVSDSTQTDIFMVDAGTPNTCAF